MKTPYESPTITRLVSGLMNKFGNRPAPERQVRAAIDGVSIDSLVEAHGSPLFVFSERTLLRTVRRVRDAFSRRRDRIELAWSYKTNYLKAICSIMHREGSLAEVVSAMEYDKARALGVAGNRIVFNGPHKPMAALRRAVAEDALINADHEDELDDLCAIARERGEPIAIGLRLNLDAGIYPQWSRFGFNLESGQALAAIERMSRSGLLRLRGLHCHLGTFILDPTAYARQIDKMAAFAEQIRERFGFTLDYLDLGGGLPSKNRLKGNYLPADVATPPVEDYADAIVDALNRHWHDGEGPRVILEPGRALVDEAGTLITTVVASKRLPDGTPSYVLDAGVNILYTATWYDFDVTIDRPIPGAPVPSLLCGPLCMNIDVVRERAMLPPLPRGTRLMIAPVGAYNVTQWMQFIAYRPAVVLISEAGAVEVIRAREDLADLEACEELPARLAEKTPARDSARS
jgi:diaminopimelate decarboxylase